MILDMETEAQAAEEPLADAQFDFDIAEPAAPRGRVNPLLIGAILFVALASGIGWYLHARGFEDTDDAQVDGHLNPVAARIDGTIKAVHVDDNQRVESGASLVELDPSDDQIALEQAQAQHDQAMAQLSATHPNLPMTLISNRGDLTSHQAEVAGVGGCTFRCAERSGKRQGKIEGVSGSQRPGPGRLRSLPIAL